MEKEFEQGKRFERRIEDFTCEKCGVFTKGSGYTDHCPKCLWSKHVDVNPGDRKSECGGMMEPIGVEVKKDDYIIHHNCVECQYRHRVKSVEDDSFDEILEFSKRPLKLLIREKSEKLQKF